MTCLNTKAVWDITPLWFGRTQDGWVAVYAAHQALAREPSMCASMQMDHPILVSKVRITMRKMRPFFRAQGNSTTPVVSQKQQFFNSLDGFVTLPNGYLHFNPLAMPGTYIKLHHHCFRFHTRARSISARNSPMMRKLRAFCKPA